jgi:NitT/TauT family transport system substrate-binding protein
MKMPSRSNAELVEAEPGEGIAERALTPTLSRTRGRGGSGVFGLLATIFIVLAAPAAAQVEINAGLVLVANGGPFFIAQEKGYFAAEGLKVNLESYGTLVEMAPLLAQGRLQYGAGGTAASLFNSILQGMPLKIVADHGSSPVYHHILVRTDLKDQLKTAADLKGRSIALPGRGSVTTYEVGKVIESAGLTLKDVELKYIPFNQMPVALANKAVDTAIMVPPQPDAVVANGLGVKWIDPDTIIKPQPIAVAVIVGNTEWMAKNEKAAHGFIYALQKAAYEYCTAFLKGPNRAEVIHILTKYTPFKDPTLLDRFQWGSRDPAGRVNMASLMDIQNWLVKEGTQEKVLPPEQLIDIRYVEAAAQRLGPYPRPQTGEEGCR